MRLYDSEFLKRLDRQQEKELYARVVLLTFDELPIKYIEGRVQTGSINIDGNSAVRRTCSLTLITDQIDVADYDWTLNHKFNLEIGVSNRVDANYPDIIWFPQGIYVMTSCNTSLTTNNFTMSISAKDKMCLLNGDIGGSLPASIDFGVKEIITKDDEGEKITEYHKIPIKDIIREMVHAYGNEDYKNIIINDLETQGLELLQYKGDIPLYMFRNEATNQINQFTYKGTMRVKKITGKTPEGGYTYVYKSIESLGEDEYDKLIELTGEELAEPAKVMLINDQTQDTYTVIRLEKNDVIGYRETELTYAGDLISSIGESITSVLDKIKNMLNVFEYFYDLDGRFVFQKKKLYSGTTYTGLKDAEDSNKQYAINNELSEQTAYSFDDGLMISSFANTPAIQNVKNDFSIWGQRKGTSGSDLSVHYRFAIMDKPTKYTSVLRYEKDENGKDIIVDDTSDLHSVYEVGEDCDWREIIYQMAYDYHNYGHVESQGSDWLETQIRKNNPDLYPTGKTGYEMFYTDLISFWREIYNPEGLDEDGFHDGPWHENVTDYPELLNFWIDFLDTTGTTNNYKISAIGSRAKVVNDNDVKAIYFRGVPDVIFTTDIENISYMSGYTYIQVSEELNNAFAISSQGKSAKDVLDGFLNTYVACAESATIQAIPIYYLQPNTLISVYDEKTNINGLYEVEKISYSLGHSGMMSLNTKKKIDDIR